MEDFGITSWKDAGDFATEDPRENTLTRGGGIPTIRGDHYYAGALRGEIVTHCERFEPISGDTTTLTTVVAEEYQEENISELDEEVDDVCEVDPAAAFDISQLDRRDAGAVRCIGRLIFLCESISL